MLKALKSTCEGWLTMRTSPSAPPPMTRRYCVLLGTRIYYYNSEEHASNMVALQGLVDVLGVQDWDGKGNVHIYVNGFLFATQQSKIFYAYSDTPTEKEMWMRAIHSAVETSHSTSAVNNPKRPLVDRLRDQLSPVNSMGSVNEGENTSNCPCCPASSPTVGKHRCYSCDDMFCEKHASKEIPLPQHKYYYAKRVCDECYRTQTFLNLLRSIMDRLEAGVCVYPMRLDSDNPIDLVTPCRPSHTPATNIALELFKNGDITAEELEELLTADKRYLDNIADEPEIPLDIKILALHRQFRSPEFTVFKAILLLHNHLDQNPMLFKPIVEKLLQFSYTNINEVEFYWPQIVHAYLRIPMFDFDKLFWMDELIMSIATRSIHLALLLMWQLQGALEDSCAATATLEIESNYPRIVRLMVHLEVFVVGRQLKFLFQNGSKNDLNRGIPIATDEQLSLIAEYMDALSAIKSKAPVPASDKIVVDKKNKDDDSIISSSDINIEEDEYEIRTGGEKVRFSDFSTFQQHLLTPHDVNALQEVVSSTNGSTSNVTRPRQLSYTEHSVLSRYFSDERGFVEQITDIAEKLRFVNPPSERKKELPGHLELLELPDLVYVPLVKATDSFEKIVRIPPKEGTAFSTKARVPVMLILEVIRGGPSGFLRPQSPTRNVARGQVFEMDDEVGQLLDHEDLTDLEEHVLEEEEKQEEAQDGTEVVDASRENLFNSTVAAPPTPEADKCAETPRAVVVVDAASIEEKLDNLDIADQTVDIDLSNVKLSTAALEREIESKDELEAAFGESWDSKRARLQSLSPFGNVPGWDIVSMIGKSNDDLRQEVFALQLIKKFKDIFEKAGLPLWLKCYRIVGTSSSTGLIETLINAISLDGLKKREGYVSLAAHFEKSYGPVGSSRFLEARQNLINSLVAYSLVTYFLQIKDRHNGNIMLSSDGHIIHIDFGFLLGIAPGGSFSIETAPFKLTAEMVEAMGGVDSESFKDFVTLCTRGFLACQDLCEEICSFVAIMAEKSPYPCFVAKDRYLIQKLRSRFKVGASKKETVAHVLYLIRKSNNNYSTRQYDNFQRMTNGILP